MEGFACSPNVCGEGQDLKPLWITHPSPCTGLGEKRSRKEGRGGVFGEGAVSSQELEEIHAEPGVCHLYQARWYTCLNPVVCSSFICVLVQIDLVKIRHSCCNPRALILPQLYFHEEADRKLLAFIYDFQKINGNWSPPHLFASIA